MLVTPWVSDFAELTVIQYAERQRSDYFPPEEAKVEYKKEIVCMLVKLVKTIFNRYAVYCDKHACSLYMFEKSTQLPILQLCVMISRYVLSPMVTNIVWTRLDQ